MPDAARVIKHAREVLPDLEDLRERLQSDPRATMPPRIVEAAERLGAAPAGRSPFESAPRRDTLAPEQPADQEATRILEDGRRAVEKVNLQGDGAELTLREQTGLEAVIMLFGRPALFVQHGSFAEPPPEWSVLNEQRDRIEMTLRSVGRIELQGDGMVGTGFLVAPDVVMTNRHVASVFSRMGLDGHWQFKFGMTPVIDYAEEKDSTASAEFVLSEIIGIHQDPQVDMALLRIAHDSDQPLPDGFMAGAPLSISSQPPQPSSEGRDVYLVGYPATDNQGLTPPAALLRIFSSVFEVKRLQPGKLTEIANDRPVFTHDCSTLGGNSGSCVIDLETHQVIGLHYAGTYLEDNFAVALWKLTEDPLLKSAGVSFA